MQPHPEGTRLDPEDPRGFSWSEAQEVDEHEHLAIDGLELRERGLEIETHVVIRQVDRSIHFDLGSRAIEQAPTRSFEKHSARDPEEPRGDGRVPSEAHDRPAGANERLLRELLGVVPISHDAQEVREHRSFVRPEDILNLHGRQSRSCLVSDVQGPNVTGGGENYQPQQGRM